LITDDRPTLTPEAQEAAALTQRPGFTKERTLDNLFDYSRYANSQGRHAVLDPTDALLTHLDQTTRLEEAGVLRDRLLAQGDGVAMKMGKGERIPAGYQDMSHIPGWNGVAVRKDVGGALQELLTPRQRGPLGVLYDAAMDRMRNGIFYNPVIHGKNLGYRAVMAGLSPVPSAEAIEEVKKLGPTLRSLIEAGGATEHSPVGAAGADALYKAAEPATGLKAVAEKAKYLSHDALWDYDKALRVDLAKKLRAEGLPMNEIAQRVNDTFGKPLDKTAANLWLKRVALAPSWAANSLKFEANNLLNPRHLAYGHLMDTINRDVTGRGQDENPRGKEDSIAVGHTPDGQTTFFSPNLPNKDLPDFVENPLDWAVGRTTPPVNLALQLLTRNSRPGAPDQGLDYSKPGAMGPLVGYGSSGWGPDVGLTTQAVARQLLPLHGSAGLALLQQVADAASREHPYRDAAVRFAGGSISDMNEALSRALDQRDQILRQQQAIRSQARYKAKRQK
jgi:hypothetical protein